MEDGSAGATEDGAVAAPSASAPVTHQEAGGSLSAADEELRLRLRQVEVAVLEYREELEERGLAREAIDAKVAEHRAKLLTDAHAARSRDKEAESGGRTESQRPSGQGRSRSPERKRSRWEDR